MSIISILKQSLFFLLIVSTFYFSACQLNNNTSLEGKHSELPQHAYSKKELINKTPNGLRIIRNEIFARHGYIFKSSDLKEHFSAKNWYKPLFSDVNHLLTPMDKANIQLILSLESELKKPLSEKITGQWVNKRYIDNLLNTKSARKSQQYARNAYIKFDTSSYASFCFSFHERVGSKYSLDENLILFDNYSENEVSACLINPETLVLNLHNSTDTMIKMKAEDLNGNLCIVNNLLFQGKYIDTNTHKKIEFSENGCLRENKKFDSYDIYHDYYDAGMDYDLLRFKSKQEEKAMIWEFSNSFLRLYEVKCINYDSSYNLCNQIAQGKLLFSLKRID